MKIVIHEHVENSDDAVTLLNEVARLIEDGFTSGYYPTWEIVEGQPEPRPSKVLDETSECHEDDGLWTEVWQVLRGDAGRLVAVYVWFAGVVVLASVCTHAAIGFRALIRWAGL